MTSIFNIAFLILFVSSCNYGQSLEYEILNSLERVNINSSVNTSKNENGELDININLINNNGAYDDSLSKGYCWAISEYVIFNIGKKRLSNFNKVTMSIYFNDLKGCREVYQDKDISAVINKVSENDLWHKFLVYTLRKVRPSEIYRFENYLYHFNYYEEYFKYDDGYWNLLYQYCTAVKNPQRKNIKYIYYFLNLAQFASKGKDSPIENLVGRNHFEFYLEESGFDVSILDKYVTSLTKLINEKYGYLKDQ